MNETTAIDRCRGVLIGSAAGDQIGGPIRMAVRLAESLLACGGFDPADLVDRYLAWWRDGAFDTGPVSDRALELMAAGMPAPEATAQVHREFGGKTAGCNPAHRSPPLAMVASIADDDLAGCAIAEARLTHHDPLAGEVAAAVNKLCRALIRGAAWQDAVREMGSFAGQEGPGNNGGYAPDVLQAAVFFIGTSACFAEALERSLSFAGPSNYCPVLVGAITGARWGASAIPPSSLFFTGSGQRQKPSQQAGLFDVETPRRRHATTRSALLLSAGRFGRHKPDRRSRPGRSPDLAHPDHPCGTPCVYPCRSCERMSWPWNDTDTPCCAVSGQAAGRESGAVRHADTTDSETWKQAEERTFGLAHVPKGLYALWWGGIEKRCSGSENPCRREHTTGVIGPC